VALHYDPAAPERTPSELAVEWDVGGPTCWNEYRGYPPFFLEGEPKTVELVHHVLAARWAPRPLWRWR
jgi:hypothetical protein